MNIVHLPVDSVLPYPKNNRTHPEAQIDRIADSIKQFGFNQPVVIDENNVCLVGHGRLLAAKKLGLDKIPTYKISNLSESQKRAYRILDNKLQNDSAWEFENLESELKLLEAEGFELEAWGLDDLLPAEEMPKEEARLKLQERFGVPPFTILDTRQGYWQDRKRDWLALGIQSEQGRGGGLLRFSSRCQISTGGKGTPVKAGY